MPSAGKSTVGVILAKVLGYNFIDSDLLIQKQEGELLKDIIKRVGIDGYIDIENQVNRDINVEATVIATGGSVVYCQEAMEHFRKMGTIVYIKLKYETILKRVGNMRQRGVVLKDGQSLKDLYKERSPLYEKYGDKVIEGEGLSVEELMEKIKLETLK